MDGLEERWTDRGKESEMDVWMDVWMYGWMYARRMHTRTNRKTKDGYDKSIIHKAKMPDMKHN